MDLNNAVASGFKFAAIAKISFLVGSDRKDEIEDYAYWSFFYGIVSGIIITLLVIILARPYYAFFNSDELSINTGQKICYIIAIITPIQVVKIIHTGVLQGLGQMKQVKRTAIIAVAIVQPICLYILTMQFDFGLIGAWIATLVSQITWLVISRYCYVKTKKNNFIDITIN